MEDIGSFWTFQESVEDLRQKLEFTAYELEMTRKESNEEIRKNNDHIKKLLQLLQSVTKERDEAHNQLRKLQQIMAFNINKPINNNNNVIIDQFIPTTTTITSTTTTTAFPATPFSPDSPLLTTHFPTKANSSITESSSFSLETQNNNNINNNNNNLNNNHTQSHVSSPAASSPDSCNIVFSTTTSSGTNANTTTQIGVSQTSMKQPTKVVDQESLIIADLAKGRPLPQKGKLLQAVLEAGPLLSTLMVAGSLPQWRNPPGALTHHIPPVNLKGPGGVVSPSPGCNKFYYTSQPSQPSNVPLQSLYDGNLSGGVMGHNKQLVGHEVSTSANSAMYNNGYNSSYNGPFGHCPSSLLDFGGGSSGSCYMGGRMMNYSGVNFDCQIPKRQRIV